MQVKLEKIKCRIGEIKQQLSGHSFTDEQIANFRMGETARIHSLDDFIAYRLENPALTEVSDLKFELCRLQETVSLPLMRVKTRYLICNKEVLQSPAGFSVTERVFIQTSIAIHTDTIDIQLPKTDTPLYVHDIDAIVRRHTFFED